MGKAVKSREPEPAGSIPAWLPNWASEPALLVASGPTARRETAELARERGYRVCVVNRSWELAPWGDLMYAADLSFWEHYKGVPGFNGLKVTSYQGMAAAKPFKNLNEALAFVNAHNIRSVGVSHKDEINWEGEPLGRAGHSGFQLLNLVLLTGADPIYLEGYDYWGDHWHGSHEPGVARGPDNRKPWAEAMDRQAKEIVRRGRTVINLSPKTLMTRFPTQAMMERIDGG